MKEVRLRTGVWYNDHEFTLTFPDGYDVVTYWPDTPTPLTDNDIRERLASPIGQPQLRDLAKGKRHPVIIVDDLSRPTPVHRIMPFLLEEFLAAGISPEKVCVLVATGTHGRQDSMALVNKIGKEAAELCRVIIHDDRKHTKYIGKTSFGTPVYVNREVAGSDLVLGVGGVYPQYTTGFGGGGKLALGILGRSSIRHLHFSHGGVEGTYNIDNDFRRDVTEISRMITMDTIYTIHINGNQEMVNIMCGDHYTYYPDAAAFSKDKYTSPPPDDAHVVIANCYPFDISYTFMRKGMKPIRCAPDGCTRIVVGSNPEGIGKHGIFEQGTARRMQEYIFLYNSISVMEPKVILAKVIKNLKKLLLGGEKQNTTMVEHSRKQQKAKDIILFNPAKDAVTLPPLQGVTTVKSWDEILKKIQQEHPGEKHVKVRIYPCSSLQCIDASENHD